MAETQIGLIANPDKKGAGELLGKLADAFASRGIVCRLEKHSAKLVDGGKGIDLVELATVSDILVVLGGDGSLLWVLGQLKDKVKPLAGVNIGNLGFLSCTTGAEYQQLVDVVDRGNYSLSERSIVKASLTVGQDDKAGGKEVFFGLNEVTISRAASSRMIQIEAWVNGQFVNHFSGDGVILSTPTGSTAYSLSAGGPVIDPAAQVFTLTPICPHALANRAIVMSDSGKIELLMPDPRDPLLLSIDGHPVAEIGATAKVRIERAGFNLPLLELPDASFYEVLHHKLGWFGSAVVKRR